MQPCLCKKHLLQVANTFDKETAFAYALDEKNCVICNKVIFIEGARRYVSGMQHKMSDPSLRLPSARIQKNA
jgi:hypothetical protein